MTLLLSAVYVLAGAGALAAAALRLDPVVRGRLGVPLAGRNPDVLARIGARAPVGLSTLVLERAAELELDESGRARLRGTKVAGAAAGVSLAVLVVVVHPVMGLALAPLLTLAGYRLPDVALARLVAARRARSAHDVPLLLDVLAVSVTAGLSPRLALERAPEAVGSGLAGHLRRARDEVRMGAPWRTALRDVAARTSSSELRRLAVTLERSERLGAPLGERLARLAADVRSERRALREERARRAPVQMLFPLVFLILPAFVLAAVVPAILVATRGMT